MTHLLKGMQLVKEINHKDTPLSAAPQSPEQELHEQDGPCNALVFYDPVGLQLNALEGSSGLTFAVKNVAVRGKASHVSANVMFDSGAEACFVARAFVERAGVTVTPADRTLTLADGTTTSVCG